MKKAHNHLKSLGFGLSLFVLLSAHGNSVKAVTPLDIKLESAADELDGVSRNLCSFLSKDLLPNNSPQKNLSSDTFIQASKSIYSVESSLNPEKLNNSIKTLRNTSIGATLLQSLHDRSFEENNYPISVHFANSKNLIGSDIPMAFSSLIRLNDKEQKNVPFIVFSPKVKDVNDSKLVMIFANELYDILGRKEIGDNFTVTANYQALGIVLSDAILKKQLEKGNSVTFSAADLLTVYRKSLGYYSSIFPELKYKDMSNSQKQALNKLVTLATSGVFQSFEELESSC